MRNSVVLQPRPSRLRSSHQLLNPHQFQQNPKSSSQPLHRGLPQAKIPPEVNRNPRGSPNFPTGDFLRPRFHPRPTETPRGSLNLPTGDFLRQRLHLKPKDTGHFRQPPQESTSFRKFPPFRPSPLQSSPLWGCPCNHRLGTSSRPTVHQVPPEFPPEPPGAFPKTGPRATPAISATRRPSSVVCC